MEEFKEYVRTNIAQMRPVQENEMSITAMVDMNISISDADVKNGSPKAGDMIARNPDNHNDKWLVAKEYFSKNFKEI